MPWWDAQIALALLGAFVQFGWEKALGGGDELGMVGCACSRSRALPRVSDDVERELRDTYSDAAASWATGPSRVYRLLADALVSCIPEVVPGARVLDLGAGTGVRVRHGRSADRRGDVVAADVAYRDAAPQLRRPPPAVCADAAHLPFRTDSFDHVVAAFVFEPRSRSGRHAFGAGSHRSAGWDDRRGSFPTERQHPAKDAIGKVVDAAGFMPPEWFATFKAEREGPSGSEDAFRHAATTAGLTEIAVHDLDVDISGVGADGLAAYRLGMAQMQPFLGSLAAAAAHRGRSAAAIAAAAPFLDVPMPMLALVARVQG